MGWADAVKRMDRSLSRRLSDTTATCTDRNGVLKTSAPVEVMVDRNLQRRDADGVVFITDMIGIGWLKSSLSSVERGDVWAFGSERFVVEEVISDDGHWVTAACMVAE